MFLCLFMVSHNISYAESIETKAKTAIIVDGDNGQILYEKNANESLPPASMTKMMTQYLVLEEIAKGKIAWDTKKGIREYAYCISNENNFYGIVLKKLKDKYQWKQIHVLVSMHIGIQIKIIFLE